MKYSIVPVTPLQQNGSVVWCEQTTAGAVIDPVGELDRIMAAVNSEEVKLTKILLTHGHMDHVGATAELASRYDLPIPAHGANSTFGREHKTNPYVADQRFG